MASGEDDVLAYVFQKMVNALKDGSIRDMRCVRALTLPASDRSVGSAS